MLKIKTKIGFFQISALIKVKIKEEIKIIVVKSLLLSVIYLNCLLGPAKNNVPIKLTILPKLKLIANLYGSPANKPKTDPKDKIYIIHPIIIK